MPTIAMPIERFLFGNEHWRSYRAIDEIEVYCDLLENLHDRIGSLEVRGQDEEVILTSVQAVLSSYAFEVAMKSLWALDNPDKPVPHEHNLVTFWDELEDEAVRSLRRLELTRDELEESPRPFFTNRYSMESRSRVISVYDASFLRSLAQLLRHRHPRVVGRPDEQWTEAEWNAATNRLRGKPPERR